MRKRALTKEIMKLFNHIAPGIVKESIERSATENPKIDLYDEDFYLDQIKDHFNEADFQTVRSIIMEEKVKIDNIFLKHYKIHDEQS